MKETTLWVLLVSIALLGPAVGYAGVSVVWPESTKTIDVNESPPITFSAGTDHASAQNLGFAGAFTATNNGASYTLTVKGMSGGTVTIDDLVNVTLDADVTSHKVKVSTALGGGISPTTLKIRLWTGGSAPTDDADPQVCAVLDLTAAVDTESSTSCSLSSKMQLIYTLPSGQTTESDTVSISPSSIVFA